MTLTWDELANGARWRGVVSFIRNWVGPFDRVQGMAAEELDAVLRAKRLELPAAVREWYLLAGHWEHGGLGVWMRPQGLAASDGMVWLLTDPEGITLWGVRVADLAAQDPPVFSREYPPDGAAFPSFSQLVAAMVVNDWVFNDEAAALTELDPGAVRAERTCLVGARCGNSCADAPLESATVVAFAYPGGGPAFGKSRTRAGEAWLQPLRVQSG